MTKAHFHVLFIIAYVQTITKLWLVPSAKQRRDPCSGPPTDSTNYRKCVSNCPSTWLAGCCVDSSSVKQCLPSVNHEQLPNANDTELHTELTICPDINGFQIPVKTSCTGHRWCKTKYFFVFCSGKISLVCFHGFLFFCFICHLCLVHKINAQTPITAILSTYLTHEFIVNVKCRMDRSHRNPYICLSFDF